MMMLVVELVVVFEVNFAMVKVVIKGVEEQFISKQPDLQSCWVGYLVWPKTPPNNRVRAEGQIEKPSAAARRKQA